MDDFLKRIKDSIGVGMANLDEGSVSDHVFGDIEKQRFSLARMARRVTGCCPIAKDRRDAIVVVVPTPAQVARKQELEHPAPERTIELVAIDEHRSIALTVSMDLESMERHVNHCTEAIAMVRARIEASR